MTRGIRRFRRHYRLRPFALAAGVVALAVGIVLAPAVSSGAGNRSSSALGGGSGITSGAGPGASPGSVLSNAGPGASPGSVLSNAGQSPSPLGEPAANGSIASSTSINSSTSIASTPIPSTLLTQTLGTSRKKYAIPGIQATIIWPDGTSWTAVSGFADLAHRVKVTPATPFAVGSITKTFTAALILELAAEGRLSLDAPVVTRLPASKVPAGVTIRQLLSHTSGVYDFFSNKLIDAALQGAPRRVWTPSKDYAYVKTPYFDPGTGWHYSNTNYVLLAQIAQGVTGHSIAAEFRNRFFGPLRLTSAIYQGVERPRIAVAHGYTFATSSLTAKPVDQSDGTAIVPFTSVTTAAGGAGAVAASSWDLARWGRALYGGKVLVAPALVEMLDTSLAAPFDPFMAYGLGMEELTIGGRLSYGHGGRLIGTRASVRYFPVEGVTVAVTTNQWRASPDDVIKALLAVALPPLPPVPPVPIPTPSPGASPTATPSPLP